MKCQADNFNQVKECHLEDCPLWSYRLGKKIKLNNGKKILSSVRSIKAYCFECSTFNKAEVRSCNILDCVLYPFRMGKNPNRAGMGGKGFKAKEKLKIVN